MQKTMPWADDWRGTRYSQEVSIQKRAYSVWKSFSSCLLVYALFLVTLLLNLTHINKISKRQLTRQDEVSAGTWIYSYNELIQIDFLSKIKSKQYTIFNEWLINLLYCSFGSEGHVTLDINPGQGYNTILLRLIPWYLLSACPHRQFHILPSLSDSRAALSNSYPNACVQCREAAYTVFIMIFGMTRQGREPTNFRVRGEQATH